MSTGNQLNSFLQAGKLIIHNMGIGLRSIAKQASYTNSSGIRYDVYEPKEGNNRIVILIYGMTIAGEKEGRMIQLARALASSGFRVVIPSLPGLKSFRFDANDLQIIEDLISQEKEKNAHWLGIIAFSVGAGMAVTVASRPNVSQDIDLLLLFSPYYSLQVIVDNFQTQLFKKPSNEKDWDHFIWWNLVLMFRQQDYLNLSIEERSEMTYLLHNYCSYVSTKEKISFYKKVVSKKKIEFYKGMLIEEKLIDVLSPKGKLNSISGRVMIFHDPDDPWASFHESEQIIAELSLRQPYNPEYQRLLVSSLMSHVSPQFTWQLKDIFSAVDIMGELFR